MKPSIPSSFLLRGPLLGVGLLAASAAAGAAALSLSPDALTTSPGSTLQVNLVASGFGAPGHLLLSAFDLDFNYDPALFSLTSVVFGGSLGDVALGEAMTGTDNTTPGLLNLWELSWLEGSATGCVVCLLPYLEDLQTSPFVLATVKLTATAAGTGIFSLAVNILGDADGNPTPVGSPAPITVAVVPEPPFPGVLGLLVLLPELWRRRRRKTQLRSEDRPGS